MSGIIKINKSNLDSAITSFSSSIDNLDDDISTATSTLSSIPSHSDFPDLTSKASMISGSLNNIYSDLKHLSNNMKTYLEVMNKIDAEGFDVNLAEAEKYFDTDNVSTVNPTVNVTSWSTATGVTSAATYNSYTNNSFASSTLSSSDINVPAGGEYNYEGIEEHLETVEGVIVTLPEGLGSVHTYMGWQCITAKSSTQYKLREAAGMKFDEEGFAKIGDRYVVATTTTYGNVGDFIDVYQEDGTIIKCVIGDIKNQNDAGCNKWGHNNGTCVIEFVVDKNVWYKAGHANPGTASCHPEWNQNIDKIVNKGNFFELIKLDAAKFDENISYAEFTDVNSITEKFVEISTTKFGEDDFVSTGTTSESYSSSFVSYCAEKAGFVEAGVLPKYETATEAVEWFKGNSSFEDKEYTPKVGDIAFYDTDGDGSADYSAIIISTSGNKFTTIENNITDNVRKATYTTNNSRIVGYGVPDYAILLLNEEENDREAN